MSKLPEKVICIHSFTELDNFCKKGDAKIIKKGEVYTPLSIVHRYNETYYEFKEFPKIIYLVSHFAPVDY